jgi:hypothetical protein
MKVYIKHIREIVDSESNDTIMGGMIRKYFNKVDTPEPMKCKLCDTEVTENTKSHVYSDPVCFDCANKQHHSRLEYDSFMNQYHKDHALCPKCKNSGHTSTLVAYAYHSGKPDGYKDLNKCVCSRCGDRHTTHERVSI